MTSNNRTEHIHNNKTSRPTQNQHFTCHLKLCSMCPPYSVALRSPDDDAIHRRSVNDCGSFRHASTIARFNSSTRRNFNDGHPRWHNHLGSNPGCSVATYLAQWTARSHASSNTHRVSGRVGEGTPSCCSIHLMCNGHIWLGSRTASLGQGSCHGSTCCLPHPRLLQRKRLLSCPCTTRRPTRHHNTAAEMLWLYCHSLDGATLVYPKLIQINYGVMLRMKCR